VESLLLRVTEVCTELRLSRTATCKLIASGAIPSIKIGGSRRILRRDLEAVISRLRCGETLDDLAREPREKMGV
jgi:excisionase family DNA binding protein